MCGRRFFRWLRKPRIPQFTQFKDYCKQCEERMCAELSRLVQFHDRMGMGDDCDVILDYGDELAQEHLKRLKMLEAQQMMKFSPKGFEMAMRIIRMLPDMAAMRRLSCSCGKENDIPYTHDESCRFYIQGIATLNEIGREVGLVDKNDSPDRAAKMVVYMIAAFKESRKAAT